MILLSFVLSACSGESAGFLRPLAHIAHVADVDEVSLGEEIERVEEEMEQEEIEDLLPRDFCRSDLNLDGYINQGDVDVLGVQVGLTEEEAAAVSPYPYANLFDEDDIINLSDVALFASYYYEDIEDPECNADAEELCLADLNVDGFVNAADIDVMRDQINLTEEEAAEVSSAPYADLYPDGVVNLSDVAMFATYYYQDIDNPNCRLEDYDFCRADLNRNGIVGDDDIEVLRDQIGLTAEEAMEVSSDPYADLYVDGIVNLSDVAMFATYYFEDIEDPACNGGR